MWLFLFFCVIKYDILCETIKGKTISVTIINL